MRTVTLRRLAVPALAALLVVAGCGDDGGTDEAGGEATSTTSTEAPADPDDEPTTTTGDDAVTITTEAGGPTTTGDDGDETAPPESAPDQEGTGAPDQEAPDASWDLNAARYRGEDGTRVAYPCPPDGELGTVWGTGTYTDDSSVCSAAVHAGLINLVEGGRVVIEIAPGEASYEGSEANGVTTQDYDGWPGSFTFPTA